MAGSNTSCDGVATTIASNSLALEPGGTYDLAASVAAGVLTVSVDDAAVLTSDVSAAVGKVGLYTSGNGIAIFEDVTVERPVAPADNGGATPADGTPGNGGVADNTTTGMTAAGGGGGGGGGCFINSSSHGLANVRK